MKADLGARETRKALAKKLGVKVEKLYPSNLANTKEDSPLRRAAAAAGLAVGEKRKQGKETSIPLEAIPTAGRKAKKAEPSYSNPLQPLAQLIIALAQELAGKK